MGKASRMKRERKSGGIVSAQSTKTQSQGSVPLDVGMVSDAAMGAICRAIEAGDVDAVAEWSEVYERSTGSSVFDCQIHFKSADGSDIEGSIIFFASARMADQCTIPLMRLASARLHPAALEWMKMGTLALEAIPMHREGFASLSRVMENFLEPVSVEDAFDTLEKAAAGGYFSRMGELARKRSIPRTLQASAVCYCGASFFA